MRTRTPEIVEIMECRECGASCSAESDCGDLDSHSYLDCELCDSCAEREAQSFAAEVLNLQMIGVA